MKKITEENLKEQCFKIINQYNNSFYRGIKMTPLEAWENPENIILIQNNSDFSDYATNLKLSTEILSK